MKKAISLALSLLAIGLFVQPAQAAISPVENISVTSSNTTPSELTDLTVRFSLPAPITGDEAILFAITPDQNFQSASDSGFDLAIANPVLSFAGAAAFPFGPHGPYFYFDLDPGIYGSNQYEMTLEGIRNSGTSGCYYGMMLTDPMPGDFSVYYSADTTFTVGDAVGCNDQQTDAVEISDLQHIVVGNVARLNWTLPELDGEVDHYDVYVEADQASLEARLDAESAPNVTNIPGDATSVDLSALTVNSSQAVALTANASDGQVLAYGFETIVTGEKGFARMKAPQPTIGAKSVKARQLRVNKLNHRGLAPTSKVVQIRTKASNELVKKVAVLTGADVSKLVKKIPKRFAGQEVVARQRLIIEDAYNIETGEQGTIKSSWSKYSKPRTLLAL